MTARLDSYSWSSTARAGDNPCGSPRSLSISNRDEAVVGGQIFGKFRLVDGSSFKRLDKNLYSQRVCRTSHSPVQHWKKSLGKRSDSLDSEEYYCEKPTYRVDQVCSKQTIDLC